MIDLGSGAGLDVFIASRKVGPTGKAIGIDMTQVSNVPFTTYSVLPPSRGMKRVGYESLLIIRNYRRCWTLPPRMLRKADIRTWNL